MEIRNVGVMGRKVTHRKAGKLGLDLEKLAKNAKKEEGRGAQGRE